MLPMACSITHIIAGVSGARTHKSEHKVNQRAASSADDGVQSSTVDFQSCNDTAD
jgi:hypothetical protein